MTTQARIREIPYNYTSFSDKEIVIRLLGKEAWHILTELRDQRRTGRSARMLFEVLGDVWVIQRNPFIQDDLINSRKRRQLLIRALYHRLAQFEARAVDNTKAMQLHASALHTVQQFERWITTQAKQRRLAFKQLKQVTHKDNICFDGISRVAHVTDATDWRVEYPFVVINPDTEAEIVHIVATCITLGLTIIPRGGGTGYTGGAIPLHADTAVINLEKLDHISEITSKVLPGVDEPVATVFAEAGAITKQVADKALAANTIFAVDPTSQHASTIGGNIAMNAGGKKAVAWGTTLDNLFSWKMVTPDAHWLEVERLNHNLGKIQTIDVAEFKITRYDKNGLTPLGESEILRIPSAELRQLGLGKDVTNKFLGGLPGLQKEGCDGLITSATFILHHQPKHLRTICLEFFGLDLHKAVSAIVETKHYLESLPNVLLMGMEHLDERYIKAVKYATKADRQALPKMLLLIDIASDDEIQVDKATHHVVTLAQAREAEGFIANTPETRHAFWQERARTAAIAAHTNAFKVNEDVVIPLERLADYNTEIERINIEYSIKNKIQIIDAVMDYLAGDSLKLDNQNEENLGNSTTNQIKIQKAQVHLKQVKEVWITLLENLDTPAKNVEKIIRAFPQAVSLQEDSSFCVENFILTLLLKHTLRISYRQSIDKPLKDIFMGGRYAGLHQKLDAIHAKIRASRLFVATHMHAGDGNIHTNIPVNSNDYAMLHEADNIVERIMALTHKLGGAISGEHGIGMTKLQFLDQDKIAHFAAYKQKVDPKGHFNKSKLLAGANLHNAYTPSLRLLEQEALILEESELGDLNHLIKNCLRCGKCKPVCNTHVPRANLLYSPRNKVLAVGLMIEAFLYEEQTRRGISLQHFTEMNDVADHCTVCHKCLSPCPVNIDFGDVTVKMRTILANYNKRHKNLGKWAALEYLNIHHPTAIKLMRKSMIQWGYAAQRLGHYFTKRFWTTRPQNTTGKATVSTQVIHLLKKPMPANIPKQTLRSVLNLEDHTVVPVLRNPSKDSEESEAVFYFPGCGSERLFTQVGLATLAMLYEVGTETVLPPGYLCCGYPQLSNGDEKIGRKMITANQVLFHRMANTLNYLDIKTILVSCGTCMDQLLKYQFQQIFPGCRLLDIHEYLLEKGIVLQNNTESHYLYHDPCHSPIKNNVPTNVVSQLMGQPVVLSERCCGEAGTFAVARPDIATQVRFRKQEEIIKNRAVLQNTTKPNEKIKLLTTCPACLQGLSRYREEVNIATDYVVVELANQYLGEHWQQNFISAVKQGSIERVLL